jgi:hypothetical protein
MITCSFRKPAILIACLMSGASLVAEPEKPDPGKVRKIMSVEEVSVRSVEGKPGRLTIEAAGMVNSGGWTKPILRLRKEPAKEGVLVFDFVATPPDGPATQALASVKASVTVDKPAGFREVEVVAQHNKKTAR